MSSRVAINIEGITEMPIFGLRINNVVASGKTGMKAFNAVALELHNVQANTGSGPAFLVKNSKEMELDNVSTRKPSPQSPVIRLDRCPGAIVRASRAFHCHLISPPLRASGAASYSRGTHSARGNQSDQTWWTDDRLLPSVGRRFGIRRYPATRPIFHEIA
jgi:hypothetical protein